MFKLWRVINERIWIGIKSMNEIVTSEPLALNRSGPLLLDVNLIDEDPHQPRTEDNPGFSKDSLGELAESIKLRGVKTPISVRSSKDVVGRYVINHGARRFRASILAGKSTIPGFIDNDYNESDQVIENLQRNDLTAREVADYIGRELARGHKRGEIAKIISKSPAFVTQHATLLDLPEPIAHIFNSGRAKDVTVINELVMVFKRKSDEVVAWLSDETQEITRGSVKLLREFLDDKQVSDENNDEGSNADAQITFHQNQNIKNPPEKLIDSEKLKRAVIRVRHDDRLACLVLHRRPMSDGFGWLKYDDDNQEKEVNLVGVQLVSLVEG